MNEYRHPKSIWGRRRWYQRVFEVGDRKRRIPGLTGRELLAVAVGQGRLMRVYSNAFGKHGLFVGQVLLTMSDITDRKRFLNIRNTLFTLLEWGVITIINENDTVAVDEIKFGDNDQLAAMVANIIEAHLVINLTSTDGLYDQNPAESKKAKLIPLVTEITPEIEASATEEATAVSMGGMKSKVQAAKKVTASGIPYTGGAPEQPEILDRLHPPFPGPHLHR